MGLTTRRLYWGQELRRVQARFRQMDNDTNTVWRITTDNCLVCDVSKAAQSQGADENNGCSFQSNGFLFPLYNLYRHLPLYFSKAVKTTMKTTSPFWSEDHKHCHNKSPKAVEQKPIMSSPLCLLKCQVFMNPVLSLFIIKKATLYNGKRKQCSGEEKQKGRKSMPRT